MDFKSSRGFALTLAHRAAEDIRRDGFRQLRNYVDLCETLVRQPKIKRFFAYAQKTLEQTDTLYYSLICHLVNQVNEDILCTWGINFLLGGLLFGGNRAKEQAGRTGQPVSWLQVGVCADPELPLAVSRAEENERFAWVLYLDPKTPKEAVLDLAIEHPYSAFVVLAQPEQLDRETVAALARCRNLAVGILLQGMELPQTAQQAVQRMKKSRMLYGLAVLLDDASAEKALDPQWLRLASENALFCVYARCPGMQAEVSRKLRQDLVRGRGEQQHRLLVLDWEEDLAAINQSICPQAVVAGAALNGPAFPLQI